MKLIDANKEIAFLRDWQKELDKDSNREYNLLEMIIHGIENESTAYDLDEVVRELKKIKLKAYELRGKPHMDYGTLCGWISATDRAIEIVKRYGGDRGVD